MENENSEFEERESRRGRSKRRKARSMGVELGEAEDAEVREVMGLEVRMCMQDAEAI